MRQNIKMRVNTDTGSRCSECGVPWRATSEMYDIFLFGEVHQICRMCSEALFKKTLRAGCAYNAKVKSKEDIQRAEREAHRIHPPG